ncbi:MAG: addiction module protein [Kofleriaceae bacterium]|nr:addiction module protein [Kofleriaceae bacterium]
MTAQAHKILEQALSLPEDDRQRLVEALLNSIPEETAEELEQIWNSEGLRRLETFERGDSIAADGVQTVAELRSKLSENHR